MTIKRLEKLKQRPSYKRLESFFLELHEQYGATQEEILSVIDDVGFIKGQIKTYFIIRAHQRGKNDITPLGGNA